MASSALKSPQGWLEDKVFRLLPEGGHEVPAFLVLIIDNEICTLGGTTEDFYHPNDIMVRLGTKVSEGHPSCVGFRVFLRTETPKPGGDSIEDNFHIISCRFDSSVGDVTYRKAASHDLDELTRVQSNSSDLLKEDAGQQLCLLHMTMSDTNACTNTHHGPKLHTRDAQIRKIEGHLRLIPYANQISVYFNADKFLTTLLHQAIENHGVGFEALSWTSKLPPDSIPDWPASVQSQAVVGSTDVLNVLRRALHEKPLQDSHGTAVNDRLDAQQFQAFVRKNYPNVKQEPANKIYPIMLNVPGTCNELPFGGSMVNRMNTYAAINALHGLLAARISATNIGIVTLYPTQVLAYKEALNECHKYAPELGYDLVQVNILEDWVHKTVGVAVVDLVRTANASGNLGYLSQANRLKVLLSRHHDGFILLGNLGCTVNSRGVITSAKLDKVLRWFLSHGRVVQTSDEGKPLLSAPIIPSGDYPAELSASRPPSPLLSVSQPVPRPGPKYVGIPGLEHLTSNQSNAESPLSLPSVPTDAKVTPADVQLKDGKNLIGPRSQSGTKNLNTDILPTTPSNVEARQPIRRHNEPSKSPVGTSPPSFLDSRPLAKKTAPPPLIGTPLTEKMAKLNLGDSLSRTSVAKASRTPNMTDVAMNGTSRSGNTSQTLTGSQSPPSPKALEQYRDGASAAQESKSNIKKEDAFEQLWKESARQLSPRQDLQRSDNSPANTPKVLSGSLDEVIKAPTSSTQPNIQPKQPTTLEAVSPHACETTKAGPPHLNKSITMPPHKAQSKLSSNNTQAGSVETFRIEKGIAPFIEKSTNVPPHRAATSIKKENKAPTSSSAQLPPQADSEVKKENSVHSAQLADLPPHKASLVSQLQDLALKASKVQDPTEAFSPTHTLKSPAMDREYSQISKASATQSRLNHQSSSTQSLNRAVFQQPLDFEARYQPKYKEIRARFAQMDSTLPRNNEQEASLLLSLAEAMVDADEKAFDAAYLKLIGLAVKAETSVLRANC